MPAPLCVSGGERRRRGALSGTRPLLVPGCSAAVAAARHACQLRQGAERRAGLPAADDDRHADVTVPPGVGCAARSLPIGYPFHPPPPPPLAVLTGHPPRPLRAASGDDPPAADTLVSSLLTSGDSLVVETAPPGAPAAAAAPTAAAAAAAPAAPADAPLVMDVDAEESPPAVAAVAAAPAAAAAAAAAASPPAPPRGSPAAAPSPPSSDSLAAFGSMTRRVVPDDNSCLFTAVAYVATGGRVSPPELRLITATAVSAAPDTYTAAVLGRPPLAYVDWIVKADTWGGAIELAVLAGHFKMELASADIQSGRLDVFGEGAGYATRAYLLYDGIHYDAIALSLDGGGGGRDSDVTQFPARDEVAARKVLELAATARAAHQFTDVASFALICRDCNEVLAGEAAAQAHASSTLHTNFEEITG